MIITYFGKQFFKITQGDVVVAINPPESGVSKFGSQLALSTTNHPDYNGFDMVTFGANVPFMISGPGEYEHSDISVRGAGTTTTIGGKTYNTTVYALTIEDTTLGFLGPIEKPLTGKELEVLSNVDILFVPIGGEGVLTPAEAYKVSVAVEPKIIIPMDYGKGRLKDALQKFLKEAGAEKTEALDKLTIRRKEIEAKEGDVIVLSEN